MTEPRTSLAFSDAEWEAVSDAINDRLERLADVIEDTHHYDTDDRGRALEAQRTLEDLLIRFYNEVRENEA